MKNRIIVLIVMISLLTLIGCDDQYYKKNSDYSDTTTGGSIEWDYYYEDDTPEPTEIPYWKKEQYEAEEQAKKNAGIDPSIYFIFFP